MIRYLSVPATQTVKDYDAYLIIITTTGIETR